jgi:release factor glutamine methyltransferase
MEHGYDQAEAVSALLGAAGFAAVESARDLAGIERVTLGRYPLRGVDAGARQA